MESCRKCLRLVKLIRYCLLGFHKSMLVMKLETNHVDCVSCFMSVYLKVIYCFRNSVSYMGNSNASFNNFACHIGTTVLSVIFQLGSWDI